MSLIKTLDEVVNDRILECHKIIGDKYQPSVRPIFASIGGNRPELIGSCILIDFRKQKYAITSAHIVDWCETHSLYIGGRAGNLPIQIHGEIYHTNSPDGRKRDKYDSAFWNITDDEAEQLGEVFFIPESNFSHNRASSSRRLYMVIGYPLSRNKGNVNYSAKQIKTKAWRYSGPVEDNQKLADALGISGNDHLFLKFGKYSNTINGEKINSINPKGISGGALIDLGNFSELSAYKKDKACNGLLAGMIIELNKTHKSIIATKIQFIIKEITKQISL